MLGHLLAGLAAGGDLNCSVLTARDGPLMAEYRSTGARARAITAGREPLEPLAAAGRRVGQGPSVEWLQARVRSRIATRAGPADLVYVNAATTPTAALLEALDPPARTPVIVHVHELDIGLRLNMAAAQREALLARADHLIAASDAVRDLLVSGHDIAPNRVTTCAEFIDVAAVRPLDRGLARQRLGVPANVALAGSVGLPDWRKDPERLLHAARRLDEKPWVAWIGGDPLSADGLQLADEARRLGLADRFVHNPHMDHPGELLAALDVFALPSREDALPLAALEAGAAGLPLVCFRTGGAATLAEGGAGIAVDYGDVDSFAEAVAVLLADPDRRRRAGATARQIVLGHHDLAVGSARVRAVIEGLLDMDRTGQ